MPPTEERAKINIIAGLINGMPYSGITTLVKHDTTKATNTQMLDQIIHNIQAVNQVAGNYTAEINKENERLRQMELTIKNFVELFK